MAEEKVVSSAAIDTSHITKYEDFVSPDELYNQLINAVKKYHPSDDISMIEKAYKVACEAHNGQVRKSGEPYIIHPLNVAIILAELEMDKETIAAGLLHDVVEDTVMTEADLEREFGSDVAILVDGVTKLEKLPLSTSIDQSDAKIEMQAENLRKMFLAMAKDIRVIMIKLADRLHNMRTLQYQKPESQLRIARETQEIYCPIAQRLGISKLKVELDDLSLMYLDPEAFNELSVAEAFPQAPTASFMSDDSAIEEMERKLSERMKHMADTFPEYLLYLISQKGMENSEVYKRAIVDKKVFSKIKNNPNYHPQKLTALCLCIGAKLNLDESKDLLARAGYALSPCDKTDIIFSYFIENKIYDMIELDIQLEEHGLPCIIS